MNLIIVIPVLVSFLISVALGACGNSFPAEAESRQTEREEGVKSHLKKAGTPTMGGSDLSHCHHGDFSVFCKGTIRRSPQSCF